MNPFVKPMLWSFCLTLLLLTLGLFGLERPPRKTDTQHAVVADTTHPPAAEAPRIEKTSGAREEVAGNSEGPGMSSST